MKDIKISNKWGFDSGYKTTGGAWTLNFYKFDLKSNFSGVIRIVISIKCGRKVVFKKDYIISTTAIDSNKYPNHLWEIMRDTKKYSGSMDIIYNSNRMIGEILTGECLGLGRFDDVEYIDGLEVISGVIVL